MKKDYMTRLEGWARWMLPPQEADDVVSDYRDIVADEQMRQQLDKPRRVIRPLVQRRPYYTWLAVFAVMALCILILGFSPTVIGYELWFLFFDRPWPDPFPALTAAVLGAVLALVWFRWQGYKSEKRSKAIPILLAAMAVWAAVILFINWLRMRDPSSFASVWGEIPSLLGPDRMVSRSVIVYHSFLEYGAVALSLLGVFALVRARTRDRRWAAVYMLAMAVMLVSLESLALFTRMDVSADIFENWYLPYLGRYALISVLGLAGAGVALC